MEHIGLRHLFLGWPCPAVPGGGAPFEGVIRTELPRYFVLPKRLFSGYKTVLLVSSASRAWNSPAFDVYYFSLAVAGLAMLVPDNMSYPGVAPFGTISAW